MPMPGLHNVLNAMAASGVALHLGIDDATIQNGFAQFGGVKRRFTNVGEVDLPGGKATVIDDYGHHPVEIRAVLAAAREGAQGRSEEHTSELQSLMRISYSVFCLQKHKKIQI